MTGGWQRQDRDQHRMDDYTGTQDALRAAARHGDPRSFEALAEPYRRVLQVHCYRMLGSLEDSEDMVQETMLRAWRGITAFEGRASLRTWLYRIATNACLDALEHRRRLPADVFPPETYSLSPETPPADILWLEPYPDDLLPDRLTNPEVQVSRSEHITLAFVAALQWLPPRQQAILILRDVLDWQAAEVATLLDTSVPAVNSALHRARETVGKHTHPTPAIPPLRDGAAASLLRRYVDAWENANIPDLIALLKEDASFSMPPAPLWVRGSVAIGSLLATLAFADGRGAWRLLPAHANGQATFGIYNQPSPQTTYQFRGLQLLEFIPGDAGDQIAASSPFSIPLWRRASACRQSWTTNGFPPKPSIITAVCCHPFHLLTWGYDRDNSRYYVREIMKPGRRTVFDSILKSQLCRAFSNGASIRDACLYANLSESTFYLWMEIGRAIDEDKPHERMPEAEKDQKNLLNFYLAVCRARHSTSTLANHALRSAMRSRKQVKTRVETATTTSLGEDGQTITCTHEKVITTTEEVPPNFKAIMAYFKEWPRQFWDGDLDP